MRKFVAAVLMCCILLGSLTVWGLEPQQLVTEANFYTGTLYYCDAARNKIVLKNVKPMGEVNEANRRTAAEAEYTEVWISSSGTLGDGGIVPIEELNRYADSNVRVLMTRSAAEGVRVVALRFL